MSSKGQGLSLNTIVIAAIVLVVLVILIGITTGYFGNWKSKFGDISDASCKGTVRSEKDPCTAGEAEVSFADVPAGKKCCASVACDKLGGRCCNECDTSGKYPAGAEQCEWTPNSKTCCVGSCK